MVDNISESELIKRAERFLFKCGVINPRGELNENAPPIDEILETLRNQPIYDAVSAIVKIEVGEDNQFSLFDYDAERILLSIGHVLSMDYEKLPKVSGFRGTSASYGGTINLWDYIIKVAKRDDWETYKYSFFCDKQ